MKYWPLFFVMTGLAGCARFEAHPMAPAQTAAQLESRRLDDAGLRKFLEQNLGHPLVVWPLPKWDLPMLSLAAFYYHPSLAVARAQWEVAQAGVKTAGGRPNPVVNVTPGFDSTLGAPSRWFPSINFDLPLETAGKRAKRLAEANELANSARWGIVTAAWQVRSNVRDTLWEWQSAERRSGLLDRQFALQQILVRRMQERHDAGDVAQAEILTTRIALQKIAADQLDAQAKSRDARTRLAGTIGVSASALDGVKVVEDSSFLNIGEDPAAADGRAAFPSGRSGITGRLADVLPLTTSEARHLALVSRADIMGALADYAAAEDDLRLEIAKQYPDVHLNPGYQFDQGDNKWSLGLSVELPVLNRNQGPIAEAEARRKLAAAKFTALQAQVISEIDRAAANYQLAQNQLKSIGALLAAQEDQQAALLKQKQAGAADQMDLLAGQQEILGVFLVQLDNFTLVQRAQGALEDALQQPLDEVTLKALKQVSQVPKEKALVP